MSVSNVPQHALVRSRETERWRKRALDKLGLDRQAEIFDFQELWSELIKRRKADTMIFYEHALRQQTDINISFDFWVMNLLTRSISKPSFQLERERPSLMTVLPHKASQLLSSLHYECSYMNTHALNAKVLLALPIVHSAHSHLAL